MLGRCAGFVCGVWGNGLLFKVYGLWVQLEPEVYGIQVGSLEEGRRRLKKVFITFKVWRCAYICMVLRFTEFG